MLHVKWDRDIHHFPFPSLDTPLGTLRAELAAYTHLPTSSFKLVHKGAVMKDDGTPLSTYKIKQGGTIALIGAQTGAPGSGAGAGMGDKAERPAPVASTPKTAPTEAGTILAIRQELEMVREMLVPDVDAFVRALAPTANAGASPTPLDHSRISELLLQSLLRLDAMHMSGVDWPEARMQRKVAVREVQGVLDWLDGAWAARY